MTLSPKIIGALIFACILLGGSIWYSIRQSGASDAPVAGRSTEEKSTDEESNGSLEDAANTPQNSLATTRTESIAEQVFGTYYAHKELDAYTDEARQKIITAAADRAIAYEFPKYTEKDILISKTVTTDTAREYKNSVRDALSPILALTEYELQTYAQAAEKNDPELFKKVAAAGRTYQDVILTLLTIQTPEDATVAHLALINAFSKMSYTLQEMGKGYDDILASFSALKVFAEAEQDIAMAFQRHKTYFVVHNIDDL